LTAAFPALLAAWHDHGVESGSLEPSVRAEVLDRAIDGVAIVRQSDGAVVYANDALKELLGATPDELAATVKTLTRSGRTDAVELAHPDFGAIRLIVVPGDRRRSAERSWRRDLRRELARARRRSWPVTVAAIALDAGGSTLLASAAWGKVLRAEDSLAAHEDGAYLAVLPDCPLEATPAVTARIKGATPAPGKASIGIAAWVLDEPLESLATRAIDALAQARAAGGDQVAIAQPPAGGTSRLTASATADAAHAKPDRK
jgi:PAS domain-containing protein